jgi:hypothetical protein
VAPDSQSRSQFRLRVPRFRRVKGGHGAAGTAQAGQELLHTREGQIADKGEPAPLDNAADAGRTVPRVLGTVPLRQQAALEVGQVLRQRPLAMLPVGVDNADLA